jgi:hypothetical protein
MAVSAGVEVLIGAVLLAGPAYKLFWAVTKRSHPRVQRTPPDLSAFDRSPEDAS